MHFTVFLRKTNSLIIFNRDTKKDVVFVLIVGKLYVKRMPNLKLPAKKKCIWFQMG